jgi:hypothetical protein
MPSSQSLTQSKNGGRSDMGLVGGDLGARYNVALEVVVDVGGVTGVG